MLYCLEHAALIEDKLYYRNVKNLTAKGLPLWRPPALPFKADMLFARHPHMPGCLKHAAVIKNKLYYTNVKDLTA